MFHLESILLVIQAITLFWPTHPTGHNKTNKTWKRKRKKKKIITARCHWRITGERKGVISIRNIFVEGRSSRTQSIDHRCGVGCAIPYHYFILWWYKETSDLISTSLCLKLSFWVFILVKRKDDSTHVRDPSKANYHQSL